MAKPKSEKFTATVTSEKTRQQKPFVQVEGKLTEAQLEAIAAGIRDLEKDGYAGCPIWSCGQNHNETIISATQIDEAETSNSDKTRPNQLLVSLTEAQLEAIAAGGIDLQ